MFLALVLACACSAHPLTTIRLTPDQMLHLQMPYRYHISIAESVWHPALDRFELEVTELYVNQVDAIAIQAPRGDTRFPRGTASALFLKLSDVLMFPDDRYQCLDSLSLEYVRPVIFNITDRKEKIPIWPARPTEQPDF